jgi:hypothetical protein
MAVPSAIGRPEPRAPAIRPANGAMSTIATVAGSPSSPVANAE